MRSVLVHRDRIRGAGIDFGPATLGLRIPRLGGGGLWLFVEAAEQLEGQLYARLGG